MLTPVWNVDTFVNESRDKLWPVIMAIKIAKVQADDRNKPKILKSIDPIVFIRLYMY